MSLPNDDQSNDAGVAANLVQLKTPRRFKPPRFNSHTTAEDGSLLLYNSYTGHNCKLPAHSVASVHRYLSQQGSSDPLGAVGEYLLKQGFIVENDVDEFGRWELRYGVQQF